MTSCPCCYPKPHQEPVQKQPVDLDVLRYAATYGQASEDESPLFIAAADEIESLRARAVAAEAQLANKEAIGEQLKSALDRSNRDLSAHTMADLHTHGCVDCGRRVDQVMEAQMLAEHFKRGEAAALMTLDKIREQVGAWIDDAPPNSPGLDLLRQIITPAALLDERQQG